MIKIGLFGTGHLGKIHLRLLKEIPEFAITGIHDSDPAVAESIAKEYGVAAFSNPDELISVSDAIDICTPTTTHFAIAQKVLNAGRHAFIEKPLVPARSEADALMELAGTSGVVVQVGYVERFNPAFRAALPFINTPVFIEAHRISEFHHRGTDVPVVLDMMIHDIDLILHIVKSPISSIHATGVAVISGSPDIANARIEFENGCVANITASRVAMNKKRSTQIFQKDCYINIDLLHKQVEVYHLADHLDPHDPLALVIGSPGGTQKRILIEKPEIIETNAIKQELEGFARAIQENTNPPVTIHDGYASTQVAFRILDEIKIKSDLILT